MSEAPDSRRPAARTRTATYFILSSPRYVRFPGLVFWRPGVSEYTPGPSLASRSSGFFLIEVIRRKEFGKAVSLLVVQFRAMDCKKIAGKAPRSTQRSAVGCILHQTPGAQKWKFRANPLRGGNYMFRNATRLFLTTAGCLLVAAAQDQPAYVRDICVKVAPGKGTEFAAMLRDVTAKQMRVRVDEGRAAWFLALSAVVPAGAAARCDYHIVIGYAGFPAETPTAEQTTAELKKAGLNLTSAEYAAKRDSLSSLVNVDIWQVRAEVGPALEKGQYARLNYYRVKPGQQAAWLKLETTGWKPLVESLKDSHLGWHLHTLAMPAGEYLHYNALTVDTFPSWTALGQGVPINTAWPKVHPDMPFADYLSLIDNTVEIGR